MRPKAFVGSSGSVWASKDMALQVIRPDLYEIEGSDLSIAFRGYCLRIKAKIEIPRKGGCTIDARRKEQ